MQKPTKIGMRRASSRAGSEDASLEEAATAEVEKERDELRSFVAGLSKDDISSGGWFTKLLHYSLHTYAEKVDWEYFQKKYRGVPPDGIVDQRIAMGARYAAIEGGLSASAYTGAVAATIGSAGGASPATVPAAFATVMLDVAYTTQLQLRLAYDISVLYGVPIDVEDPDDLWKLIRIALTIKGGEVLGEGAMRAVPLVVRPLVKKYISGSTLTAVKSLPLVGKYLLQRNIIKIGIPLVGVPLSVVINRQSTLVAGRHAKAVLRKEADMIEIATTLSRRTEHPRLLLWVAWLVANADGRTSDDEALLLRHLFRIVEEQHGIADEQLSRTITIDPADVRRRVEESEGDLSALVEAAERVASIDGSPSKREQAVVDDIRGWCAR